MASGCAQRAGFFETVRVHGQPVRTVTVAVALAARSADGGGTVMILELPAQGDATV